MILLICLPPCSLLIFPLLEFMLHRGNESSTWPSAGHKGYFNKRFRQSRSCQFPFSSAESPTTWTPDGAGAPEMEAEALAGT